MNWKANFTYSNKSHGNSGSRMLRIGVEVYRHPENRFAVLEFSGDSGKFREAFYLNELMPA